MQISPVDLVSILAKDNLERRKAVAALVAAMGDRARDVNADLTEADIEKSRSLIEQLTLEQCLNNPLPEVFGNGPDLFMEDSRAASAAWSVLGDMSMFASDFVRPLD
jgi:hypothetical protein